MTIASSSTCMIGKGCRAGDAVRRSNASFRQAAAPIFVPCARLTEPGCRSVRCFEKRALDVAGLGDGQHFRMIHRLSAQLAQDHSPSAVCSGRFEHLEEERLAEVVRAACGEEEATGSEQAHRAKIDLLVSAQA